jgi:tRNA (pseudouridine54-N1)-methyltransferase
VRRFVVIGQTASASPDFLLQDFPGTSGRLDVLLRCVRAALLVSHGVRQDTLIYLVLLGGPSAPRTLRVDGSTAQYLRPDERSLAILVKKSLAVQTHGAGFASVRPGIALANGGLEAVLDDLGSCQKYLLDERASDLRQAELSAQERAFFLGDHLGLSAEIRAQLEGLGALAFRVGPISLHADDALAVLNNELDRRERSQHGENR